MTRPFLARFLHDAAPARVALGSYNEKRQLTLDPAGTPLVLEREAAGTLTKTERPDPGDPDTLAWEPGSVLAGELESLTRVRQEPTDPAEPRTVGEAIRLGGWSLDSSSGVIAY